jgi:hypothetical protein
VCSSAYATSCSEGDQATVVDDFAPAVGTGLAADPGQNFAPLFVEAEYAWCSFTADGLKMTKQSVNRRSPRPDRSVHRLADPLDPAQVF